MEAVEALIFDVFGTVVDWFGTVTGELRTFAERKNLNDSEDWGTFAMEWRQGYVERTHHVANGGSGSLNVDIMHREILDSMLKSPRWSHLASLWTEEERQNINLVWHRLNGWPDATEGLYALKKRKIIATLSNGNVRLLVDMAKHANLPWDVIFSAALFGSYKPNPATYLGAAQHLSLPPSKCAMVAAHIGDLRAAASNGMKTIYVRRPAEDRTMPEGVRTKKDGGEVSSTWMGNRCRYSFIKLRSNRVLHWNHYRDSNPT